MDYFDSVKGRASKISLGRCIRPNPNGGGNKDNKEDLRNSRHWNFKHPAKIQTCTGNSPKVFKN